MIIIHKLKCDMLKKINVNVFQGVASQAAAVSPQPRSSPVRTQPAYRIEMASKEQKLFEMGFLDHGLNATLLIRHNGDMDRVIAELIEPI